MKKSQVLALMLAAGLGIACSQKAPSEKEQLHPESPAAEPPLGHNQLERLTGGQHCYLFAENGDSLKVSLTQHGEELTGRLERLPREKDRAVGTFRAVKAEGEKWNADYQYSQEGQPQQTKFQMEVKSDKLIITGDPVYAAELQAVPCP